MVVPSVVFFLIFHFRSYLLWHLTGLTSVISLDTSAISLNSIVFQLNGLHLEHFAHLLLSVVSHLMTMGKCVVLSSLSLSAPVTDVEPG